MVVVAFIAFGLFNFTGDPVQFMVGQDTTIEDRQRLRAELGLDKPFYVQFVRYRRQRGAGRVRPVAAAGAQGVDADQGAAAGDARARDRRRRCSRCSSAYRSACTRHCDETASLSHVLLAASLIGVSLPTFLIGILLILVFAVQLGWLPSFGRGETVGVRLVDHRPADQERAEGADPAEHHAVAHPDDADHASRALRDARGAAHRLHQVRARARPHRPRHPLRPRAQEHAGAGDHDRRPAARRASSRSRS